MGVFAMNRRIIRVFNSQTIAEFINLMDSVSRMDEKVIRKLLTSKWYVWNIIRNKDFYKLMSVWLIETENYTDTHFLIMKLVLETANNDITRRSFIKAIIKKKCILTVDTIKYIDGLEDLVSREEVGDIITDDYIKPLVNVIGTYETRIGIMLQG